MFGLTWVKLAIWAGAALALIGVGFAGGLRWDADKVSSLKLQIAQNAATANQKTVDAISKSVASAIAANNDTAQKAAEREQKTAALIERLSHVPTTANCTHSPAVRTYLDGLRDGRADSH